ncbi:MAG: hypothetical protein R6V50_06275 [Thermoplasmatota archaeon]
MEKEIKTHLVPKRSPSPIVCTYCDQPVKSNELYYIEQGVTDHVHSLIARKYCGDCYAKYGEKSLLNSDN